MKTVYLHDKDNHLLLAAGDLPPAFVTEAIAHTIAPYDIRPTNRDETNRETMAAWLACALQRQALASAGADYRSIPLETWVFGAPLREPKPYMRFFEDVEGRDRRVLVHRMPVEHKGVPTVPMFGAIYATEGRCPITDLVDMDERLVDDAEVALDVLLHHYAQGSEDRLVMESGHEYWRADARPWM